MKKIALFALISLAIFALNTSAQTSSLSLIEQLEEQIRILSEHIETLRARVQTLKSELSAPVSSSETVTAIPEFTRNLGLGASGDDVRELQRFLSKDKDLYPEGLITGYFGPLTEGAVKKWQAKQGIVSGGTFDTTGYGYVGPKTLFRLNELLTEGAGKSGIVPPGLTTAPGIQKIVATTTPPTATTTAQTLTCSKDPKYCKTQTECASSNYYWYTLSCHNTPAPSYSCAASNNNCINPVECSDNGWYWCRNSCYSTQSACAGQTYVAPAIPTATTPTTSGTTAAAATTTASTAAATTTTTTTTITTTTTSSADTQGPWISSLSISPTSGPVGTKITFTVTAEDPSGVQNVVYDIKYPGTTYYLRPNCYFYDAVSGTCTFTETIDHAMDPKKIGDYVIETIRTNDKPGNVATYYPNGTVNNAKQSSHNLTIPAINISEATQVAALATGWPGVAPAAVNTSTCSDSDNGIVFGTKGTITGKYPLTNQNNATFTDYCRSVNADGSDPNWVQEYYCYDSAAGTDDYITQGSYYCPTGYSCTDGACRLKTSSIPGASLLAAPIIQLWNSFVR